jgi:N-hydroxyarylamine O-acetyltransferase
MIVSLPLRFAELAALYGDDMRLHDYLHRVGVKGPLPQSLETLRRLHVAHREAFLFENLTIQEGGGIGLGLDTLEHKFLDDHRGGYCFEHNTLFAAVLCDIGFSVVTLLGRVRRGPPERRMRTHMVLTVPIDGASWLADVGFGGLGLLEPLPLVEGAVAEQAGIVYTLRREHGLWILAMRESATTERLRRAMFGDASMDLYEFTDDPQTPGDVEMANHYTATHPDSLFKRTLTIQRTSRTERLILRGDKFVRYREGDVPTEETVTLERAREIARELFGIEIA